MQIGSVASRLETGVAVVARGLLIVLAAPSIAALAFGGAGQAVQAVSLLAEVATIPAFLTVSGWLASATIATPRFATFVRALAPAACCGLAGVFAAAALAAFAGLEAQQAVARAAPVWSLALAPAVYAIVARALYRSPAGLAASALAAHVFGVVLAKPILIYFVFYLAGMALAARRDSLARLVDDEPEFALASGPFVAVLAVAVAIRFSQTGQAPSVAAIGPIALALGLAAGPTMLASATALGSSSVGEACARLGRAAPALAVFWVPIFSTLLVAANRGLPPSAAGALLMAVASLLLIAVLTDLFFDMAESRFRREPKAS